MHDIVSALKPWLTLSLAACISDDGDPGGSTPSSAASASGGAAGLTITAEDQRTEQARRLAETASSAARQAVKTLGAA